MLTSSKMVVAAWVVILACCSANVAIAQTGSDAQVKADVLKALDKKQFKDVHAETNDGVVKLTGTVPVYADKEDADRRVHHRSNVKAVDNEIQVVGPAIEDQALQNKLVEKLEYDRVGYGTTAFNSISVSVHNGVVTLGGTAYGPVDKDSALSLVAYYPGVKDVIDNITVDPLSPNDDSIRLAAYRAIYGYPIFAKYAIDPGKPIRITVVNGNITLTGVVDSQGDKDVAFMRANGVSGAFKVTNQLQVANEKQGKK